MRSITSSSAKLAIGSLLVGVLCLGLCQCALPSRLIISTSTEPFHIKTNDTLGIRLGMSLADYKHGRKHFDEECSKEDADAAVTCNVVLPIDLNLNQGKSALTVGGVEIDAYYLTFYEQKLIGIQYWLSSASLGLDPLRLALQDKFGTPRIIKDNIIDWLDWKNTVSSLSLHGEANSNSITTLTMRLDKQYDEWLAPVHQRENDQARKGL